MGGRRCLDGSAKAESSDRVCKHMNEDHAASCLAFAWTLAGISSASSASLSALNVGGFDLRCSTSLMDPSTGKAIEITTRVPFAPPLKSDADLRPRLVELHHAALAPRLRYLLPPLASLPLLGILVLAYTVLDPTTRVTGLIDALGVYVLRSRTNMAALLIAALLIHFVEASAAFYFARRLKLSLLASLGWFVLTIAGGNVTLSVVQKLDEAQRNSDKKTEN